jgi:hypothetical protein
MTAFDKRRFHLPAPRRRVMIALGVLAGLLAPRIAAAAPAASGPLDPAPWVLIDSFWFLHGRADLADSELRKTEAFVRFRADHPGARIGILLPADNPAIEPGAAVLNRGRVQAIRDALGAAGISTIDVPAGTGADRIPSLDRRIMVFGRVDTGAASAGT